MNFVTKYAKAFIYTAGLIPCYIAFATLISLASTLLNLAAFLVPLVYLLIGYIFLVKPALLEMEDRKNAKILSDYLEEELNKLK